MKRVVWTLTLVFVLSLASGVWAGAPTDQLRDGVDRVFTILRDPVMAGATKATARRNALQVAAAAIFDFGEMAKQSLGQHWTARTAAERSQFVALFTDLMQHSYIAKVDQHGGSTMVFRGETVDGDVAAVRTTIALSNGSEMPLEYRMRKADIRWQVYDLSIDGISLVANYRAQFDKIIRTASYEDLVAKLRAHQRQFSPTAAKSDG